MPKAVAGESAPKVVLKEDRQEKSGELTASQYRWSLLGLGCSVLLFTLDLSIVNVALPTLVKELHTDFPTVQWVVLSYLLVVASLLSTAARAGDLYSKKRLFLRGLGVFIASSLGCALASSVGVLIAARAVQGLGAVMVSALAMAIVTEIAPPSKRGKAIGTVGGLISLGVAAGPTVGGLLIAVASWHWIFAVNVPVGIAAYWLLHRHLPALEPKDQKKQGFDFAGMVSLGLWLVCLDLGLNLLQRGGTGSTPARGLLLASVGLLVFFLYWESRHTSPLISLELFKRRAFSVGLCQAMAVFVVLAGALFLMPFFLEIALGYEPLKVGWLMAVSPVCAGLASPRAGALADRVGSRRVTFLGTILMAVGCFLVSTFHPGMSEWRYILAYLPFGLGVGVFQAPNNSAIMGAAPQDRMGTASGLLALSRTLGQSLGLPAMATVFMLLVGGGGAVSAQLDSLPAESLFKGVHGCFLMAGWLVLITGIAGYLALRGSESPRGSAHAEVVA